jgi:hypothetical protein
VAEIIRIFVSSIVHKHPAEVGCLRLLKNSKRTSDLITQISVSTAFDSFSGVSLVVPPALKYATNTFPICFTSLNLPRRHSISCIDVVQLLVQPLDFKYNRVNAIITGIGGKPDV